MKVIVKDVEGMAQRKSLEVERCLAKDGELHSEFSINLAMINRR
jgi:hypothetical protein